MSNQPVIILGVGPVSPAGVGREEMLAAIREGLEPVAVGELNVQDYVSAAKTYLDPNSAMTICSVAMALKDAGLVIDASNATSVGMGFGTRLGNITTVEAYLKGFIEQGPKLASPLLFIHAYPNTSVSLAAIDFGIKGTSFNFNSGRFAGLQAVLQATDEIRRGKMSVMLACAADTYTEATRPAATAEPFAAAATVALGAAPAGGQMSENRATAGSSSRAGCRAVCVTDGALSADIEGVLSRLATPIDRLDWVLADLDGVEMDRAGLAGRVTGLHEVFGDGGAATAVNGLILAALVMAENAVPAGIDMAKVPDTACVISADASGAAAAVLHRTG